MESTKLNEHGQAAFESGNAKALLTRINSRRWCYALGWKGEARLTARSGECRTRSHALIVIKGWLHDYGQG
jgi:hypothetical protein